MQKVTIKDIADLAGVSKATVSRTIHSPHLVKPGTRDRILRIMENRNYVYDAVAGDLSRKKASVIGLIIPTIKNSIFSSTVYGMQEKAEEYGYTTIIGNSNYDMESETRLMKLFQQRRMAGLIITGLSAATSKGIEELVRSGIPCVVTWETTDSDRISYAGFDNYKAAYSMVAYLNELRHRRIGLMIGPYTKVGRARRRFEGYRTALKDNGIDYDPDLVVEREYTMVDGKEGMHRLLSLPEPPTAVFAASDVLAMGALAAVKEKGLRVPEDISLAGFDDIEFAAYLDPPLTTVRIPAFEMGQLAVKALFDLIDNGPDQVRQYCLDTDLIIRKSCSEFSA
ncbi:MAG: LacI family transcriptional regulator [Proteobacteria bacterium]|nr:LacI family transcriptional regulator [Pseudomonadota bacterium]